MKRMMMLALCLLLVGVEAEAEKNVQYFNTDGTRESVYYYNPDGGRRYHATVECKSIKATYWSGMKSFPASEMEQEPYAALAACEICVGDTADLQETTALPAGTYVVGVDIQAGMYGLSADEQLTNAVMVTEWNDEISQREMLDADETKVVNLYNEQTLYLPEGSYAQYYMSLQSSAYDTGTRQLQLTAPGRYDTDKDLRPGLYVVEAMSEPAAALALLTDGKTRSSIQLQQGVSYTVCLAAGDGLDLPKGCMLRSMTTQRLFQQADAVTVSQARYHCNMQMPLGCYTITGVGNDAWVRISLIGQGEEVRYALAEGESMTLDTRTYDDELLVELVNVTVAPEPAEG